ncbi:hypothetical protein P9139_07275 [Curtobacterium flaccumfaciens]|nr:hypothetical protein P9139_07275 [Curtobacterium flaccumfaciens]
MTTVRPRRSRCPSSSTAPSVNPQASAEHERETLGERIPPAAPVPPTSTAPHPSSISLPTARSHRDQRAAENRAIEDERRRVDPFGEGRSDVDWLGRATGSQPTPTGPVAQQPLGVENVLPTTDEPPSFTELLRIADAGSDAPAADRPFDWAIRDDETGEVPATLTTNAFDTTALAGHSWTLADEADDDVVSGELETPVTGTPVVSAAAATTAFDAPPVVPTDVAEPTAAVEAAPADDGTDETEGELRLQAEAQADPADAATTALPVAGTPWWAEPEATVPPTAAPPLVEPAAAHPDAQAYPAHLPPAVGQDLDAVMGIRAHAPVGDEPAPLPAAAPDDLDQSEWDGRETSDTSAIKDLFGTEAVGQLGGTGYDPHDTGTRMMPAVGGAPAHAPAPGRTPVAPAAAGRGSAGGGSARGGDRDNFINEGFAKLRNEGQRGKRLLIWGSIALIVVLLVAVFALTRWILGNTIEDHTPAPTSTSAASAPASKVASATAAPSAPASSDTLQTLQFATTPAAPGEQQAGPSWRAGSACRRSRTRGRRPSRWWSARRRTSPS